MDSKEIADRLDGMKRGNLQLDLFEGELWLTIRNKHRGVDIFVDGEVSPSDLLAFCRAVVERVDKVENPCAICHKERGDNLAICTPCKERMTKMRNDPKYRELR